MGNDDVREEVRVLIIEDDADARETCRLLLESDGYAVRSAASGEEGLAQVREFAPACVLVDLGLPGIDGTEVTRRLRDQVGSELVIIAVTGSSREADHDRAEAAGIDFVLTKPLFDSDLRRLLPPLR